MKPIRTVTVGNTKATLFANGDVIYGDQHYPSGVGCNLTVLRALMK